MEPNPTRMVTSCILRLDTSPGWHKTLTNVLEKGKDVSYSIDKMRGFAYIFGDINPSLLLKLIAKSGKHAELCQLHYCQYNQQSHEMPSVHQQSSQDEAALKSLEAPAPETGQQSSNSDTRTNYQPAGRRKTMTKIIQSVKGSKRTKTAKMETSVTNQLGSHKHLKSPTTAEPSTNAEHLHNNRRTMPMAHDNGPYYDQCNAYTHPGFQRMEDRCEDHAPYPYYNYGPQQYSLHPHCYSYEPTVRFFPQAQPPPANARPGEPDLCTIV